MFQTFRARLTLAVAALLLLGGGALMSGPHRAGAQGAPTPAATETCTAQDATATAEPTQAGETDTANVQCGDQTGTDGQNSTDTESSVDQPGDYQTGLDGQNSKGLESSVEPTASANDQGGDNVDQPGDHQDPGDTQPDAADSAK
jgi:hypothetical protein